MARRITLRDIARSCGCHHTTVGLALRGHSRISAETTRKIQDAARQLGYRPNPLVSAWMTDVRMTRSSGYRATIAYLIPWRKNDYRKRSASGAEHYLEGARARAAELGYGLRPIFTIEEGAQTRRIQDIMRASGICGAIISPLPHPRGRMSLDWSHLSVIQIGLSMLRPNFNRILHNQYLGMQTVVREAWRRGYKRIGLIMDERHDARTNYNYSSVYLHYQSQIAKKDRLPIHWYSTPGKLEAWRKRYAPDCVIGFDTHLKEWIQLFDWRATGIASVDIHTGDSPVALSGIDQRYPLIGATAVDLISSAIEHNLRGIPPTPTITLTEGIWVEGKTLPKRAEIRP